jgi:hypothetical protein
VSTAEIREKIDEYLDRVADEKFLRIVYSMLDTYLKQLEEDPLVGYDIEGNPLHASEAKEKYATRLEEMKKGRFTSVEDLKKEAEQW